MRLEDVTPNTYLTTAELAGLYRLSAVTVAGWCKAGRLRAVRAGRQWRVRHADWLAFATPEAAPPPAPSAAAQARRLEANKEKRRAMGVLK